MSDIFLVINKCYELLQTRLTFGIYSFTLFAVLVCFSGIGIAGWFFGRLFSR